MGAITEAERARVRAGRPVGATYDTTVDRESAFEMLARKANEAATGSGAPEARPQAGDDAQGGLGQSIRNAVFGTTRRQGMVETMAKQTARTVGNQVGRRILRGLFGGLGGRR